MASESVARRPPTSEFVLPFGFVQSPVLASLALDLSKLGSFLRKASANVALDVSLYMDDLVISSDDEELLADVAANLDAVAVAAKFPLSASKRQGPGRCVTAFNIELSHKSMAITSARMTEFQEAFDVGNDATKGGIYGYVASVNSGQALLL